MWVWWGRAAEVFAEFGQAGGVAGRTAGGVDEDGVHIGQLFDRGGHLGGGHHDLEGDTDDVGVGAELLDGGDAVGVGGDEADLLAVPEFVGRGELCDGGSFAYAGGADEGDGQGSTVDRAGGEGGVGVGEESLDVADHRLTDDAGVGELLRGELVADGGGDVVGEVAGDVGLDELHVVLDEGLRHRGGGEGGDAGGGLENLADHALDGGELSAEVRIRRRETRGGRRRTRRRAGEGESGRGGEGGFEGG